MELFRESIGTCFFWVCFLNFMIKSYIGSLLEMISRYQEKTRLGYSVTIPKKPCLDYLVRTNDYKSSTVRLVLLLWRSNYLNLWTHLSYISSVSVYCSRHLNSSMH
jgi:hypothetical protein